MPSKPMHRFALLPSPFAVLSLLLALPLLAGCVSLTPYEEVYAGLPPGSFLDVDGYPVYVEVREPAEGAILAEASGTTGTAEWVVFVHGFGASAFSWREVAPRLEGYRTVALDLHGFGWSQRPPGIAPYTREGQIALILAVMDRLGAERFHLVGHSYGGALSIALAEEHPERLQSLVLVNAAHPDYLEDRRTALALFQAPLTFYLRLWALRPRLVRRGLERSMVDDALVTDELVREYLDRLRVEGAPEAYRGLTAPVPAKELPPLLRESARDPVELEEVPVPTLVVWGQADPLITVRQGREATDHIPCHRFVVLPDVGHMPMEEAPVALAEVIQRFLEDLEQRSAAICDGSPTTATTAARE